VRGLKIMIKFENIREDYLLLSSLKNIPLI
jgi:hypothetical protein